MGLFDNYVGPDSPFQADPLYQQQTDAQRQAWLSNQVEFTNQANTTNSNGWLYGAAALIVLVVVILYFFRSWVSRKLKSLILSINFKNMHKIFSVLMASWNKIKSNPKTAGGLALVSIAIFLFYWFQLRPAAIRESCYSEAYQESHQNYFQYNFDQAYAMCLLRNGMAK